MEYLLFVYDTITHIKSLSLVMILIPRYHLLDYG